MGARVQSPHSWTILLDLPAPRLGHLRSGLNWSNQIMSKFSCLTLSGLAIAAAMVAQPAQAKALVAGQTYFNVHTAANPGGELRDQVVRTQ